jgi:hypothetical protein
VNVRSPLEVRNYSEVPNCVSDWTVFVPPVSSASALRDVSVGRARFDEWIKRFRAACDKCVIDKENDFDAWLRDSGGKAAGGLIILSHHASNALYFYDGGSPSVQSSAVTRSFSTPSVAIITACGSGKPGAADFIHRFNAHGASAVIATSNDVDSSMGGTYLTTLLDTLADHAADTSYTLTDARFDSVQVIRTKLDADGNAFGPRALAFLFAGSGDVRACVPKK